ncbi:MAG TPA: hypothetical protein VEU47_10920 [Candidatus Cybelea sp.]|nr:hypothetical protein [Candidatus Cybelea sp.]
MTAFWQSDPVAAPAAALASAPQGGGAQWWENDPVAPKMANSIVRSAATGVPIVGGFMNKLDAATNAALAPVLNPLFKPEDQLQEPTFAGRYAHSLADQQKMDQQFAAEHPVLDTAAQLAGGVASGGALLKAAPAVGARVLGLGGETLPGQVLRSAVSGAGINAADALARGEDPEHAALTGGVIGAAAPAAARLAGAAVNAVRNLKQPAAIPQNIADIAGVPVRQSLGQATGDTEAIAREQMALRGNDNSQEQAVARNFYDAQKDELAKAREAVAAKLSPSGEVLAQSPQEAASVLLDSLGQHGQQAATDAAQRSQALTTTGNQLGQSFGGSAPANMLDAANVVMGELGNARALEQNEAQRAAQALQAQGEGLRRGLNPGGGIIASSPMEATNIISGAVGKAAEDAQAARTAAYGALRELPGQFHPAAFNNVGEDIRSALNAGDNPVRIDPQRTPQANAALNDLDDMLSSLRQQRDENGRVLPKPPTTTQVVETARQRLNSYLGDAIQASRGPQANFADVRAMREVIDGFDNQVERRLQRGTFIGGDPQGVRDAMQNARALNTTYRRTFTPQGPGDEVGQAIQKIVGRYEGQAAPPEQIASMLYGKGGQPVKIAQRLVNMFGQGSPEIGAIKQGLFSHLTEAPGLGPLDPETAADRIDQFLASSTLPHIYLSAAERQGLSQYAQSLRGAVTQAPAATDQVARMLPKMLGEGGGQPMTAQEAADTLFGRGGAGESPIGVKLAQHVMQTQGPASPAGQALRRGLLSKLQGADSAETAANINEFLTGRGRPMAEAAFTPEERAQLQAHGEARAANAAASAAPQTQADKVMARLTGQDGHAPPTATDVVNYLNTTRGTSQPVALVHAIKSQFGETSREVATLKTGQWRFLTEENGGPLDVGSKAVVKRINDFLDGSGAPLAHAMFSKDERDLIRTYGDLMGRITPPPGTVNYSNTASILGKMFRGTMDGLFAAGGVSMAGPVGVAAGFAAHQGQKLIQDAVKASKVARSLYGTPQSAAAFADLQKKLVNLSTVTSRGMTGTLNGDQSRRQVQ